MGIGETIKGAVKSTVGDAVDDEKLQAEGEAQQTKGQEESKANEAQAEAKAHEKKAEALAKELDGLKNS